MLARWSRGRYTLRRTLCLLAALAVTPGMVFALFFVRMQCYPSHRKVERTPASLGLPFEPVQLTAPDGIHLAGWYVPPPSPPAPLVLLVHGHAGKKDDFLEEAAFLHRAGFGTALVDLRHHGESGTAVVTFGIREAEEAWAFVERIWPRPEHRGQKLGVIGWSMGAVTALRITATHSDVAAVVADSPFDSLIEQARWRIHYVVPAPAVSYFWLFALAAGTAATGQFPWDWEVTPWLASIAPRPIFLIHGKADTNIEYRSTERLAAAAPGPVEKWLLPGVQHIGARRQAEAEYSRRVSEFFRKHLSGPDR